MMPAKDNIAFPYATVRCNRCGEAARAKAGSKLALSCERRKRSGALCGMGISAVLVTVSIYKA
ncbi:MAG: hypothetical protein Q4E17_06015 [Synergistes sp.]|nr:hypothetical protein [Synergistes sp.]